MDILSILGLLRRRKWVALGALVVSAVALTVTVIQAPPLYRATSTVVLLAPPSPPPVGTDEAEDALDRSQVENPYVGYGDLSIVVDIVRRVMMSRATEAKLRDQGLVGDYEVAANADFYRGPIVDISAEAATPEAAAESTALVAAELEETLVAIQSAQETDPAYFIRSDVVVAATRADRVYSSTLRRVIAVGAVSVLLILGSAVLADTVAESRRRARALRLVDTQGGSAAGSSPASSRTRRMAGANWSPPGEWAPPPQARAVGSTDHE